MRTTAVLPPPSLSLSVPVLFIGAIVGATVETIEINQEDDVPHNYGAVTRWIVMYPVLYITWQFWCMCVGEM